MLYDVARGTLADAQQKVHEICGLGELVADDERPEPDSSTVSRIRRGLDECIDRDPSGRPRLSITLADDRELESLAQTLARLLVTGN